MKLKKFKKIISGTVSAMMIAASIPAVASAADQQTRGNIGGYDYEMWNQNGQGQASMNPGAGSFTCSWSNIENFLARMGKNFDSQKQNYKAFGNIVLTYDVEYTPRGNSYMCVYGWTRNPLMEYYIVEGWGDWRPPGNDGERKGNVTLNGNTYEIAKTMRYNQPSLDGTSTFPQYWSIRTTSGSANNQTNYMKGTIDVSKHFDAWSQAGLDMSGTLYEVSLNIEGYRSNGSANVKSVTVTTNAADSGNGGGNDWNQGGNDWNQGGNDWNQGGFDFGNMGGQDWNNWNQGGNDWNQGGNDWNQWNQGGNDWNQGGQDWNNWNQGGNDWNQGGQDWNNWNQGGQDWNNWNQGGQDWNNWNVNDWNNQNQQNNWNQGGQDWNNWNQGGNDWNQWNQGGQDWNNQQNNWNQGGNDWNQGGFDWNNWNVNDWNNQNQQNNWNQGGQDWNNQQQNFDWNQGGQQNFDWNQGGQDWNNQQNNNWYNADVNNWNQGGQQNFDWNQGGQQNFDWNQGGNGGFDWNQGGQQQANNGGGAQVQSGKKLCAISFDDGASATSRQDPAYRIMDALIKNNMTATFFYVGDWIKTNEQVQFAYQNGMEVANHTKSHPSLGSMGSSQIRSEWEQCNSKLKSIIGTEPSHLMRLPYLDGGGQVTSALYDVPLISCAIDTEDWNNASKDQIVNKIKQAAQNGSLEGAIVLCHENYATTAAAMEEVLPWLAQNGYQNVNISDMAKAKGKTLGGGQIHTRV